MAVNKELYDILGLEPNCSAEQIKKAYRKIAKDEHPDKGGDAEKFKKLNQAYEILSNPEKREHYDCTGKVNVNENDFSADIFKDIFSGGFSNPFANIFEQMMGQNRNRKKKCPPIIHKLDVSLENLCTRKVVKLKITRERICDCVEKNGGDVCQDCQGKGIKITLRNFGPMIQQIQQKCEKCDNGKIYKSCEKCDKGKVTDTKIFEIYLTPEMENGYNYILQKEGNQYHNTETGDVVVVLNIKQHPFFKLEGKNLIYLKTISLKEALCGIKFDIVHPSGEKIEISVSDVIEPETIQIIPKGMTIDGKMEIRYKIVFPTNLSKEQKTLFANNLN